MTSLAELPTHQRAHVARYARGVLIAADALGKIPTPLDDVAAALQLSTPEHLYDLAGAPPGLAERVRRLLGRVAGALAVRERMIYVDRTLPVPQQRFTHGHEIGHRALPWHEDAYFGDDKYTLDPETREELEAEANSFSADLLFNLDEFTQRAHASRLGLAPALDLAVTFGTGRSAAIRRYVVAAPRPCALLVLGRYLVHPAGRTSLRVLRSAESDDFLHRYGPIAACMPTTLALDDSPIARDAYTALYGHPATPVLSGDVTTLDSRRGVVRLDYEIYSNTYRVFVLLMPHRRLVLARQIRAQWRR